MKKKYKGFKNSGYSHHGASRSKSSVIQWQSSSKSPHEDISENLELLRERSRDLYAGGGPLGRGAIDRLSLNAIGTGLKLNVKIDNEILGFDDEFARRWAAQVEAEFDIWASSKNVSFTREFNFYELQGLAFKSMLLDGECLAVLTDNYDNDYSLSVMLIEAERLANPYSIGNIILDEGVELDSRGVPIAYWIANRNPNSEMFNQKLLEYQRVSIHGQHSNRRNILHLFQAERINQHRGVPFLSPVIELLKQIGRYTDAELMAAVLGGMYAICFQREPLPTKDEIGLEESATDEGLAEMPNLEGVSMLEMNGTLLELPEGVKPVTIAPNRPNTSFDAFVQALTRQIGGALGIPYELLFLHFTASYSASRGALLEAWKLFRYWREWFSVNFCQPIYEEFFTEAVLKGRIYAPGFFDSESKKKLYTWASWTGPSQGQLDPVKEVRASILRVENGFSTYQKEASELTGEDFDLNIKSLIREHDMMKKLNEKESKN